MEREYSDATHELIERMRRNVEDKELVVDRKKAEELFMKTYDLFDLDRPKRVVWCIDVFDAEFYSAARSAGSAWSARSAGSTGSARSARSAGSAWLALLARSTGSTGSTGSARSAGSAWLALLARSAWSARSALSAGSAGSAWWTALDYDFDWFVVVHEYAKNREGNQGEEPNENDYKYLEYSELLMQAKEAGLGYRVESGGTLYLVPTPIVRINEDVPPQFHSDQLPAIEWRDGSRFYFLDGVSFEKELWDKVVSKEMSLSEIMRIEISDQRTVALKYNPQAIIKEDAVLVHKDGRSNELYLVENSEINSLTGFPKMWFLKMTCPTGRIFIEGVPPDEAEKNPNATDMQALLCGLTSSEYAEMLMES